MLTHYYPEDSAQFYSDYYTAQDGHGLSVYRGRAVMPGHGLGSIFSGLLRTALPILKRVGTSVGKSVGKRVLRAGARVAGDVLTGKNLKNSAKQRLMDEGKFLLKDVTAQVLNSTQRPPMTFAQQQARLSPKVKRHQALMATLAKKRGIKKKKKRGKTIFS